MGLLRKIVQFLFLKSNIFLTQRVVDAIGLLFHLLVQSLHVLHQQGHHLTLQLRMNRDEF